jgi:hypothetical protein
VFVCGVGGEVKGREIVRRETRSIGGEEVCVFVTVVCDVCDSLSVCVCVQCACGRVGDCLCAFQ